MVLIIFYLILSLIILFYGAEFALDSSEKIGLRLGLSPLVIGLVLVGFGTSLPEFFVSQLATMNGESNMALGNVIGSNVANILLILGLSSFLVTLPTDGKSIRGQLLFHSILVLAFWIVLQFKVLNLVTSSIFLLFFIYYLYITYLDVRRGKITDFPVDTNADKVVSVKLTTIEKIVIPGKFLLGFTMLYFGGELLVYSGTKIGEGIGISTFVISAIIFAFGTSFPELFTAIIACLKKKDEDIIIGNIIGSNVFNIAFVIGSLGPYRVKFEESKNFEMGVLFFLSILFLIYNFKNIRIGKKTGTMFLLGYLLICWFWIKG